MVDLLSQAQRADSPDFVARVKQAIVTAARDVMGEALYHETLRPTAPTPERHAARAELAQKVLGQPDHYARVFAQGVSANPSPELSSPVASVVDNAVLFTVNSLWDDYAGLD